MSQKSQSMVPIAAGVVAVLAGGWFLLRDPGGGPVEGIQAAERQPEAAPPVAAPAKPPESTQAPAAPPTPTPARGAMPPEDFFAGELDDVLADAHARLLDGKPYHPTIMRRLVEYREAHPDDGRPNLLLAYDAMGRGAEGHAVRLYRMAWQNDPGIKRDPRVLTDLIEILATHDRTEYREGTQAIEMMYGDEAIDAIEQRLQQARQGSRPKQVERLEKLKQHLQG